MTLPYITDFNNTGSNASIQTWDAANWAAVIGTIVVSEGNDWAGGGAGDDNVARFVGEAVPDGQYAIAKISDFASYYNGPAVRVTAGGSLYHVYCGASTGVSKFISGSYDSDIGPISHSWSAGDLCKIEARNIDASTVELKVYSAPSADPTNFTLLDTFTDTSGSRITSGTFGVWSYSNIYNSAGITEFEGGSLGGGGGGGSSIPVIMHHLRQQGM